MGRLDCGCMMSAGGTCESYDDDEGEGEGDREGRRGDA